MIRGVPARGGRSVTPLVLGVQVGVLLGLVLLSGQFVAGGSGVSPDQTEAVVGVHERPSSGTAGATSMDASRGTGPVLPVDPSTWGQQPTARPVWTGRSVVRQYVTPDQLSRPDEPIHRSFTVAATGDLLIHSQVRSRAAVEGGFDFGPQLAAAQPDIEAADLGLCHLEVPLDPDGPFSSYPIFNAPADLATAISETGWDVCSTASNHSADKGMEGVVATLTALDDAGVGHRGMARSAVEALQLRLMDVAGVQVGLLSATYGLNGLPIPGGNEWSVQLIDPDALIAQAGRLRDGGAEVVIVSLHWGAEYRHAPTDEQQEIATLLLTDGSIDAIIGHHAHVVQPVDWIAGRPVVYGLGNFLSGQRPAERRDGAIVTLVFQESADGWSVDDIHARPTWVDDSYGVVLADPTGSQAASAARTLGYLDVPLSPSTE